MPSTDTRVYTQTHALGELGSNQWSLDSFIGEPLKDQLEADTGQLLNETEAPQGRVRVLPTASYCITQLP